MSDVTVHVTCPGCKEEADVPLDLAVLAPEDREVLTRYPKMVAFCVSCDAKMKASGESPRVALVDDAKVMYDLLSVWHANNLCPVDVAAQVRRHRPECVAAVDAYCYPSWEAWVEGRLEEQAK